MPDGIDQSWGFADPKAAKAAGVQVVSMYLSWDQSKNITKSDVLAYHGVGIGVMLNWESQAGAPLNGANQGRLDAQEAVRQAKALIADVGYSPAGRLTIYFSCDTDINDSQLPQIEAYYKAAAGVCHAAGFNVGCYGEATLVHDLAAKGITDSEWQTYAWSGGIVDPATDYYQYNNGQQLGGAEVDFDRIIHRDKLGAWWAKEDEPVTDTEIQKIVVAVKQAQITKDGRTIADALRDVDDIKAAVAKLSAPAPAAIDYDKLAEKVADKLAARLAN